MANSPVVVVLPTHTKPVYEQKVLGRQSSLSTDLEEFRGIPFGAVPGRWQHSYVRDKLPEDIYSATSNGPKCPQSPENNNSDNWQSYVEFPDVAESETDCLNLFVIRPSVAALTRIGWDPVKKLPVMIWIHGGGYSFGAGTDPMWDPSRLVLQSIAFGKPIITVNINYRLSIFGFAASPEIIEGQAASVLRGCNFAIRDQKVGLKWVSQNIAAFGGDPIKITIGGQSAGGSSVHAHVLEAKLKAERPLFRNACIQSGAIGTLGPISMAQAEESWGKLCQHLGIQKTEGRSRLDSFQNITTEALIQAARDLRWDTCALVEDNLTLTITGKMGDYGIPFVLDFGEEGSTNHVAETHSNGIQILIGDSEKDGSIFSEAAANIQSVAELRAIFEERCTSPSLAKKVLESYGLMSEISQTQLTDRITDFLTDVTFTYPVNCARRSLAGQQPQSGNVESHQAPRVYQRTTVLSYKIKFGNPFAGPCCQVAQHCIELIYLFDAFHDHMAVVDVESLSPQSIPSDSPRSNSTPSRPNDSGYLSEQEYYTVKEGSYLKRLDEASVSNAVLRETLQRQWISFIADEQSDSEQSQVGESTIVVYGKDRRVTVESMKSGAEWIKQEERLRLLAADWTGATAALKEITGAARR